MAYKVSKRLKRIIDGTGGMTSASAGVGAAITGVAVTAAKSSGNAGNAGNGGNNTGSSSGISGYTPTRFTPASESGGKYTVSSAVKRRASSDAALRRNGLARVNSAPDTDDTSVDDYYRELNDVGSTLFDWSGGSSYVDSDTRKTLSDRISALSSGYGDIRNYALERAAKEGYSDDDVKALAESLKSTENYLDSLGKAYGDIDGYYSKFADRDTYLAALEDYDKYGIFAASDDFDTKSAAGKEKYESEKKQTEMEALRLAALRKTDASDGLSDAEKRSFRYSQPGLWNILQNDYLTSRDADSLSEADKAKYYALYADAPERADEFAKYALERQYSQDMQKISEWAGKNAGTAILADAAALLATPFTGDKTSLYLKDRKINGSLDKARYTVTASDAQSALQQGVTGAIEKATEGLPGSDGLFVTYDQNVYSFLHNAIFSTLQSYLLGTLMGGSAPGAKEATSLLLGSGAASSAITNAYDRGASPEQALTMGLISGSAEFIFEEWSIGDFVKLGYADTISQAIKSILIQGGVEGSEEFCTTLANTIADLIIMSDKSQYALDVAENLAAGMSDKEAKRKAGVSIIQSLVSDTLAGFISGAGMAGGKVGYTSVSEGIADSKAGAAIRAAGNAEELIGQIKKITGSARTSLDYIDRVGLDASSAGMQTEEAGAGNRAKDRRTQRQLGRALRYFGYDTIENSADAAVGKYDSSGGMSYDDYLEAREEASREAARKWRDEGAPAFTRAASGKTQAADNAAAGTSVPGNTAEAASGQEKTTFDNADIYDEELPFDTSEDEPTGTDWKQEIAGYAKANGISDKGARLLEEQYSSEVSLFGSYAQTAQDFAKQWDLAYTYGRTGRMRLSDVAAQLGNDVVTQFSAAYELGLSEYRERQAARYKKAAESNKLTLGGNMRLISEEEAAKYNVNTVTEELDGDRRVQVEALREFLAGSPANAVFYESNRNELGKSIGEQGFYDPETHTMYIDVNAGNNGEGAILRTAAHELTHMLQQTAPKEYDALADFVINYFYSADPAAVGQLVADKVIRAQENGRSMGEAAALNDIVADACENMLTDADALSALSSENRTLFERFKAWLDEMIGRLKAAISKFGKGSKAGELLGQDLKSFESARRLWFDAYKAAAERTTGNTDSGTDIKAEKAGDIQYSERSTESGTYDEASKEYIFDDVINRSVDSWKKSGSSEVIIKNSDVDALREINKAHSQQLAERGRKGVSINDFTDDEVRKSETWARKFQNELGIKSPFFRRWFGDWRAYDTGKTKIVKVSTLDFNAVKDTVRGDSFRNSDTGWDNITVGSRGIAETINKSRGGATVASLSEITELINNAVLLDTELSNGGKGKANGSAFFHKLYSVVDFNGKKYIAKISVEEYLESRNTKKRFYVLQDIKISPESARDITSEKEATLPVAESDDTISISELFALVNRFDKNFSPKGVLRELLDDDGVPKVVYHGTNSEFTVFRDSDIGYWFSESYDYAESMAEERGGRTVIPCYIHMENPLSVKLKPMYFSNPSAEGPFIARAKQNGNDGVIFINDTDSDYAKETFYLVFDKGQVKSAENNIGTYNGGDEDIELSDRDTDFFSDREILTMALDETVDDPDERSALETYKKLLPKIKEYTAILDDTKKQIHSLTFDKSTHVGDWRARLEALKTRRDSIAKRVAAADKQLLDMEHAPVLQGIIDRQRQSLEKRDRYIRKLETRFDEYKESRTQSELRSRFLPKVESMVGSLTKEVTSPTRTRHVPEALREPLARFLASIDMSSPTMLAGTRVLDKDAEFAESLDRLYDVIREYSSSSATDAESGIAGYGDFDIAPQLAGWLNDLRKSTESIIAEAGNPGSDGFVLSRMSGRQLQELARILRSLSATAHNAGKFISSESTKYISDIAESAVKTLDAMPERDYKNGTVESFLKYDNMTPVYVFDRYGDAGKEIFRLVTQGQSKLAEHIEEIRDFCSDAFTPEQREAWSNQIHEVQLGGRTERMSTAQIMDLYLLTKRKQARGHLLGEGFRIGELKLKEKNKKTGASRVAVHGGATVSEIELASIIAKLTPEQIETADKLQKFASTVGAQWGNEITMKRWGYRHYTELNYWPIVTDETTRDVKSNDKKGTAYSSLYRIINGSFTKEIVPNANNRIVVDNIFEVFSSHMAQMAQLNAMGLQTVDTVRWLNYRVKNEDGSEYNLRRSSERALGKPAERYLLQLLDEMNGARVTGQDEGIGNAAISRYNRAQVMFNMRVAIQQPFSIIRAANEMSPKYLSKACRGVTNLKKLSAEMEQYSGEAKWKFTLGFARPELAQNADVLLEKKQTAISKLAEASTALAEKGDHLTWTVLWNACRLEVADKNPGIVKNNSEYMSAVGERFSDIVYRTQVFDSIFAKSQWMRNGTFYHRLTSSFMAEPTLDYNVLASRAIKLSELRRAGKQGSAAWKSAMKDFLRASSVFCASGIVNAVVTAFADAWRDDDDYETFAEKYLDAFRGNLIDNLIPTDLLPLSNTLTDYAKTALGLVLDLAGVENNIYGYESRRTDMEHLQLMVDALEYTGKFFGGSGSYTAYGMAYSWMRALSAATGIPVAAASREAASAFNNIADIWNNTMDFMGKSAYLPKLQTRTTSASAGYEALARAYTEGDEKAAARLRRELSGNLKGEDAEKDGKIADGVRSAFRTLFDSGNGEITDEEMLALLTEYGGIDENEAYFTVEKWKSDVPAEYSKYDAYFDALDSGDSAAARERLAELTSHGVDESAARSAVTSRYRKAYLAADETEQADLRRRMKKTGLYTSAQLEKLIQSWEAAGGN